MKKLLPIILLLATPLPAFAADIKEQDAHALYIRYCMNNGGVREICECSYTEAKKTIKPNELETVVKTLNAGVPSNQDVMAKMNDAVQTCAGKVEKGELKIKRATPAMPVTAPVPPAPPTDGSSVPPPPPPPGAPSAEPVAIPQPAAKDAKKPDDLSIDYIDDKKNPAKSTKTARKKAKKNAAPKKDKKPAYYGQYDNQFFDATVKGDLNGLRAISQQIPSVDLHDVGGNTPLMTAVMYGRDISLNFLLENHADPNARNNKDQTALHLASFIYRPDMVEKLLSSGAKPDLTYGAGLSPLMLATMKQDETTVNMLLKYRAKPDLKMKDGNTALHLAAGGKNMNIIGWLVTYGANVNIKNDMGTTPLMLAAYNGNVMAVQYLVGYKADTHLKDKAGRTAADLAQAAGHFEIAQFLARY